jgi:DNA-binding MarR family transcriptional regulator
MSQYPPPGSPAAAVAPASLLARAERLIEHRRLRDRVFADNGDLFGDPGFDILLWVFVEGLRNQSTTVAEISLAANVRSGTALRWVAVLAERGLIERQPSHDNLGHVSCSATGRERLTEYLQQAG